MGRKRIFLTLFTVLILVYVIYNNFKIFHLDESTRTGLVNKFAPYLSNKLSIGDVRLGLGSIHFEDVNLREEKQGLAITISDIEIKLNIYKLFKSKFNFQTSLKSITILGPELYIDRSDIYSDSIIETKVKKDTLNSSSFILSDIPLELLTIKNGTVILNNSFLQNEMIEITNISGVISEIGNKNNIALLGDLYSSNSFFTIKGNISNNLKESDISIISNNLILKNKELQNGLILKKGSVNCNLNLKYSNNLKDSTTLPFLLNGNIDLNSIIISNKSEKINLKEINGSFLFVNNSISTKDISFSIFGSKGSINISSKNIFSSEGISSIKLKGINLVSLRDALKIKSNISGLVNADFSIASTNGSIGSKIKIYTNQIYFNNSKIENIYSTLYQKKDTVFLDSLVFGLKNLSSKIYDGKFTINTKTNKIINFKQVAKVVLENQKQIKLKTSNKIIIQNNNFLFNSDGNIFSSNLNWMPNLKISIRGNKNKFKVSGISKKGLLNIKSTIIPSSKNTQFDISIKSKRFQEILPNFYQRPGSKNEEINFSVKGDFQKANCIGKISYDDGKRKGSANINGSITNILSNPLANINIKSNSFKLNTLPLPFNLNLILSEKKQEINNIKISNFCKGSIILKQKDLAGYLSINNFRLHSYFQELYPWAKRSKMGGTINGSINISGTIKNPILTSDIRLIDGSFGKLRPVSGKVNIDISKDSLLINSFSLETPSHRFLNSNRLNITSKGLQGDFSISNFNLEKLKLDSNSVNGILNLKLKASTIKRANLDLTISNFALGNYKFKYFSSKISHDGNYIHIKDLKAGSSNITYNATGKIISPFANKKSKHLSTDINLNIKGNLFNDLAIISKKLVSGKNGNFKSYLHFTGGDGSFKLKNGYFKLGHKGKATLNFPAVLEPVKNTKVFIGINNGIAKLNLTGKIGSGNVSIITRRPKKGERSFIIPGINLDIGVFHILSSRKGVSIRIPPIFEEKEYATCIIRGNGYKNAAVLSGPIRSPHLKGKMYVSRTRFTFPFLNKSKGESPVTDFLSRTNWDVDIIPGNNLKYFYNHRIAGKGFLKNKFFEKLTKEIGNFPFIELDVNKTSKFHISGRINGKGLKFAGKIISTKGNLHFSGRDFNQDLDVGIEFLDPNDNTPYIWGTATAIIRPINKTDIPKRLELILYTRDTKGGLSRRGKLNKIEFKLNGELEAEGYYTSEDAYKDVLSGGSSTNDMVSRLAKDEGKAYFSKVLWERLIASKLERKVLGLGREYINPLIGFDITPDVFRIESGTGINYFNMFREGDYFSYNELFGNTEFIAGKYFLNGDIFFKYASQLEIDRNYDRTETLDKINHRVGFELQKFKYLSFNMDYQIDGMKKLLYNGSFNPANDLRANIRLNLPVSKIKKIFSAETGVQNSDANKK